VIGCRRWLERPGPRGAAAIAMLSSVLLAAAISTGPSAAASSEAAQDRALARRVCGSVKHELLLRVARGYFPGRSGQIQFVAHEPNFVDGGLTHSGPWDYDQEVPLLFYGPGWFKPGSYSQPATLADVAPTEAAMLGFDGFHPPDGRSLSEALAGGSKPPPRVLVTMVWDSAGMDLLNRWPKATPYLSSLRKRGAWFSNVIVGASPSNTPVGHATIGTGAYPDHNGFADEYIYMNGKMQKPNENGPGFLIDPTLADQYDTAMGNKPKVAMIATLSAHIMMESHGTMWGGGDRDIAVTREKTDAATAGAEGVSWSLTPDMAPFYDLPDYVNKIGDLSKWTSILDAEDGKRDGKWRQNTISQLNGGFDTPARTPYQTELVKAVVRNEGFGADNVPDLLDLNYKAIDTLGHAYSADGIELSDALEWQDRDLKGFVAFMNHQVGKGKWAMVLTADHGMMRDPNVTGAFRIGIDELTADIEKRFDSDGDNVSMVIKVRPTELWLNEAEVADNGTSDAEIADYIDGLTQQDTLKANLAPAPDPSARVFDAAFPSSILSTLPCLPGGSAG
jgi:predicted AlkP superfamily pyrophosphatase or phosphodiesterase